jgi:hypothetical protein
MREEDIDRIERIATLRNDQRVREQAQGTTFHQHAQSAANDTAGGRFAATGSHTVVGAQPLPKYPAASTPFQRDPVPDEPPLGIDINAMPELDPSAASPVSVEGTGGAAAPSAPPDVEPAPPSSSEQTNE